MDFLFWRQNRKQGSDTYVSKSRKRSKWFRVFLASIIFDIFHHVTFILAKSILNRLWIAGIVENKILINLWHTHSLIFILFFIRKGISLFPITSSANLIYSVLWNFSYLLKNSIWLVMYLVASESIYYSHIVFQVPILQLFWFPIADFPLMTIT